MLLEKRTIQTLARNETINLTALFRLDTVGKILQFFTDMCNRHVEATEIKIDWKNLSDHFDWEECREIRMWITTIRPESDEEYTKRLEQQRQKDKQELARLKATYGESLQELMRE